MNLFLEISKKMYIIHNTSYVIYVNITYQRRVNMAGKKISTTVYITEEQKRKLETLHNKTKVPIAEYIRQGIDLILEANKDKLVEQINLPGQIGK